MDTNESSNKFQLYTRLGFGGLVAFGTVGSLAGYRQGSAIVFATTIVGWCLTRIVVEALEAWRHFHAADRDSGPPPNPPTAAA